MENNPWGGTSFHNDVINLSYDELVERIGEPTHGEPSGDGKVQKEWQIMTDDNVPFTIYDWKEYNRDVTDGDEVEWHVGHHNNKGDIENIVTWLIEHDVKVEKDKYYKMSNY